MDDRAALTERWMEEHANVSGGPWTGRAQMQAAKDARIAEIEHALAVIHAVEGHGPYVVSYKASPGPRLVRDQKIDGARRGEAKERRCVCGEVFSTETHEVVVDDRTFDGYTRRLRQVQWPGHVWKGRQNPIQPRDPGARRGRRILVHGPDDF
jgi:hypothetical protein